MRMVIGLVLGGAMAFAGLAALVGGADMTVQRGFSEEAGVAFGFGAVLLALGVMIMVISVKAARARKAARLAGRRAQTGDRGEVEGMLFGVGMATLGNDDLGGGDGGDFSD